MVAEWWPARLLPILTSREDSGFTWLIRDKVTDEKYHVTVYIELDSICHRIIFNSF